MIWFVSFLSYCGLLVFAGFCCVLSCVAVVGFAWYCVYVLLCVVLASFGCIACLFGVGLSCVD